MQRLVQCLSSSAFLFQCTRPARYSLHPSLPETRHFGLLSSLKRISMSLQAPAGDREHRDKTEEESVSSEEARSDATLHPSEDEREANADSEEQGEGDFPLSVTEGFLKLTVEEIQDKDEDISNVPVSVRTLASWIEEARQILVLTGAGVSVAAGIPDFRTPGTGLYDNLQKYNLPFPEAVFDLGFYRRNPQPFCSLAREMWPGVKHAPTLTHSFVALLAHKKRLLRNYSQNIDGLEYIADTPAELLVECHGHYRSATCIDCKSAADAKSVQETIVKEGTAPRCTKCRGLVKPDIVFFGENLPDRFHSCLGADKNKADLILVLGTSLQVAPVSLIPDMVHQSCKRALINRDLVGSFEGTCRKQGSMNHKTTRDVFVEGDCDDIIRVLAKVLGWHDELQAKHEEAVAAIRSQHE